MKGKVKTIMGSVFNIDATSLEEKDLNPDHIEQWDSFSHLIFITCLEEELDIEISPDEIPHLKCWEGIVNTLETHGVKMG